MILSDHEILEYVSDKALDVNYEEDNFDAGVADGIIEGAKHGRNETAKRTLKQYKQELDKIEGVSRVKKIELLDTLKEVLGINYEIDKNE